jgi:hypothetical protein
MRIKVIISVDIDTKSFAPYAIAVSSTVTAESCQLTSFADKQCSSAKDLAPYLYVSNVGPQAGFITRSETDGSQVEVVVDKVFPTAFFARIFSCHHLLFFCLLFLCFSYLQI